MKKNKLNIIIFTILSLLVVLFWGYLLTVNMMPIKYILMGLAAFVVWLFIVWMVLFYKNKSKKRNIIGYVISSILVLIMFAIFFYLNDAVNFLKTFDDNTYKEETYLVLVLKESNYKELNDLSNKNIGYVPSEITGVKEALKELDSNVKVSHKSYEVYDELINDVKVKKIESMLIEKSYYDMLNEENNYDNLLKVIHSITVKTEIKITKSIDITKDTFSIYISGIDSYGKIATVSRSDVNIVATINPKTKQVLLISVPRDYYVQLKGTTGLKDKLTHAGVYGIETSVGTLEDLLDVDIHYYFRVNFSSLEKIVDSLGGVDVFSKYSFVSSPETGGTYSFSKGYNHMNGKQALSFSRERYKVPGGDRGRGENQQAVIDGIIRKGTSSAIITKYKSLLSSLKNTFQSNINDDDISKLIKMQLGDMAKWNITSYSLNGSDGHEKTYSTPRQSAYVMIPTMETVIEAQQMIDKVISGEKLSSSYSDDPTNIKTPTTVVPKVEEPKVEVPKVEEPKVEEPKEEKPKECEENCIDKKPFIKLNGSSTLTLSIGEEYKEEGVEATDSIGEKITNIKIEHNININKPGKYTVTYTATDILGNNSSVTRTVIVVEEIKEDPPLE